MIEIGTHAPSLTQANAGPNTRRRMIRVSTFLTRALPALT